VNEKNFWRIELFAGTFSYGQGESEFLEYICDIMRKRLEFKVVWYYTEEEAHDGR